MKSVHRRVALFNIIMVLCLVITLPVSGSQSSRNTVLLHMGETEQELEAGAALPAVLYPDDTLLGWSSQPTVTPTDLFLLPGIWYQPQSRVPFGPQTPTDLYAHPRRNGQYAVFDPAEGSLPGGGNMVVYGSVTSDGIMEITVPDGAGMKAPDGWRFDGWKSGSGTVYRGGETLRVAPGAVVVLQAQWAHRQTVTALGGGLYLALDHVSGAMKTYGTTDAAHVLTALYASSGKQRQVSLGTTVKGSVETVLLPNDHAQQCRVYLLDEQYTPMGEAVSFRMEDLYAMP